MRARGPGSKVNGTISIKLTKKNISKRAFVPAHKFLARAANVHFVNIRTTFATAANHTLREEIKCENQLSPNTTHKIQTYPGVGVIHLAGAVPRCEVTLEVDSRALYLRGSHPWIGSWE